MSTQPKRSGGLAAEAAGWIARLSSPQCTASDRADFERWLAEDDAHAQAFISMQRLAVRIGGALRTDPRLRAMAAEARCAPADVPPVSEPAFDVHAAATRLRRWMSAAASLAAFAIGAVLLLQHGPAMVVSPVSSTTYSNTERHERTVLLADGSRVFLDAGAEVSVAYSSDRRVLQLKRGRAYFDVAHDAARPFAVEAGGTRTVALGTRFEVALEKSAVRVTLAQGSVVVTPADVAAPRWREVLKPGQRVAIAPGGAERVRQSLDAERAVAWTQGRLEFDGTPLREALDAFNRYSAIRITLGNDSLGDVPIGGSFAAAADGESFVKALAAVLPLHYVQAGADEIVLFDGHAGGGS
jgi:transmembrane sensor